MLPSSLPDEVPHVTTGQLRCQAYLSSLSDLQLTWTSWLCSFSKYWSIAQLIAVCMLVIVGFFKFRYDLLCILLLTAWHLLLHFIIFSSFLLCAISDRCLMFEFRCSPWRRSWTSWRNTSERLPSDGNTVSSSVPWGSASRAGTWHFDPGGCTLRMLRCLNYYQSVWKETLSHSAFVACLMMVIDQINFIRSKNVGWLRMQLLCVVILRQWRFSCVCLTHNPYLPGSVF